MQQNYRFDFQAEFSTKLMIACQVGTGGEDRLDAIASQMDALAGEAWQCMETCWILLTDLTVAEVRNVLRRHLATDDRLLVALLNDYACWHGFEPLQRDWLLARL